MLIALCRESGRSQISDIVISIVAEQICGARQIYMIHCDKLNLNDLLFRFHLTHIGNYKNPHFLKFGQLYTCN